MEKLLNQIFLKVDSLLIIKLIQKLIDQLLKKLKEDLRGKIDKILTIEASGIALGLA